LAAASPPPAVVPLLVFPTQADSASAPAIISAAVAVSFAFMITPL
jgi:hypothetical protein